MTGGVPPLRGAAVLLAVGAAVAALGLPVRREVLRTTAPHTAEDVERFGGQRTLGQAFFSPEDRLSEIHIALRPPVPTEAFPLIFHLKHGRYAETDIRTVALSPKDLDEEGVLRVRFLPVAESARRSYAFTLEARLAPKRIAVYRQIDGSLYDHGYLYRADTNEDRPGDLEFVLVARQPRLLALWRRHVQPAVAGPEGRPPFRGALATGVTATGLAFALLRVLRTAPPRRRAWVIGGLVLAHLALHAPFVLSFPGVNDEGSYLMDIQNLRQGVWPFRDTLAKGPLFLLLLAPVALFLPHTLFPARFLAAGMSSVEVVLLYFLGRRLGGELAGLLAALLWALSPIALAQTSQLFLQPFSVPFVTLAFITLLGTSKRQISRPCWAGVLLGLAYLVRASSLAFLLPALLLAIVRAGNPRGAVRAGALVLGGFAVTLGLTALLALSLLGTEKTAVMLNLEAFLIGHARGGDGGLFSAAFLPPPEIFERFAAFGATLFRTGLPLLLLWAASVSGRLAGAFRLPPVLGSTLFVGTLLPLLQRVQDMNFTLAGGLAAVGTAQKALMTILVLALAGLLWRPTADNAGSRRTALTELVLVGVSWISLILLYGFFGRFRQQYHAEFLPLYVLGSALFLTPWLPPWVTGSAPPRSRQAVPRTAVSLLLFVTVCALLALSAIPSLRQPHTGSIPHRTARDTGRILRQYSSPGEPVLTAQGLFTFYADRPLLFGASHPGWYLEERVGTVPPELRRLFFPDKEAVRAAVAERVRLVAIDRRTREVYFLYDPAMQELLKERFRLLETVENPYEEHPVEIWIRNP